MRRLLTILLMVALLSPIASATITNSVSGRPTADWFGESTGTGKNVGILFLREVETAINAGYSFSSDNLWVADSKNTGWGNVVGTPDVNMAWDGTNFLTTSVTADTPWVIGTVTTGFDITYTFETTGTIVTDYDGDSRTYSDAMSLIFGSNSDASIQYDEAGDDNLEFLAAAVGMSFTTNDALFTLDNTAADQFKVNATGVVAGNAIHFKTTDGGILLDADGGTNGDITIDAGDALTFTAVGAISYSDKSITNVGDLSVDDIISDADGDIYLSAYKTVIKTIDVNVGASTDDFQLDDTAANQTEQPLNIGAIIPAYASIVSVELRCFETVTGSATMGIDIGTATGGAEVIATANVDTANDISATAAGDGPEIVATNAARSIWVNFTPNANWNTLVAGRWAVMVTYVDFGAVYTQKNP